MDGSLLRRRLSTVGVLCPRNKACGCTGNCDGSSVSILVNRVR